MHIRQTRGGGGRRKNWVGGLGEEPAKEAGGGLGSNCSIDGSSSSSSDVWAPTGPGAPPPAPADRLDGAGESEMNGSTS